MAKRLPEVSGNNRWHKYYYAEQYGEQDSKGSLEPGKLADIVILDRNPLAVEPMAIKDIKVVETIKEGRTIYTAGSPQR